MKDGIVHKIIEIEEEYRGNCDAASLLEDFLSTITVTSSSPEDILRQINEGIARHGFIYEYVDTELFAESLQTKKITCGGYCLLYYAIGESFHLPLHIVLAPGHSFIRWQDSSISFNWETTADGEDKRRDDDHYFSWLKISQDAVNNGTYLQNLRSNEILAIGYNSRGYVRDNDGDRDGAIRDYTTALAYHPKYAKAFLNRGYAKDENGDSNGAIADYTSAIALDPCFTRAYNNRGIAERNRGNPHGAISDFRKALELDPSYKLAENNLRNILRMI